MQLNEGTLLTLAHAVADGSDVDWDRAESSAEGASERDVVSQLRTLARIGQAARSIAATWGPLEIRGEVGGGSFGTVYRAWDTRLEREVALKLLRPEHAAQHLASTVVKEGRLLAQIRHPNVVTVHGADVFDARVGIWMEFVTGRTLKEILQEQGPFGAHEAALIGRDLCRALAAVHKLGFLHRDIKAQNVMREAGGRTVLMDFGAGDPTSMAQSAPLKGSPVYLAPEVLDGGVPTPRSDLYALGVLLYHLVSGEFPVTGQSILELQQLHAEKRRTLLRDIRPDLPSAFVRVVDRAIAVDPSARPETAGEMEALLEEAIGLGARDHARWRLRIVYAVTAVGLTGVLGATVGRPFWEARPAVQRHSIAILPFRNLTADSENEYFSKGVTDDIADHLARLGELRVISGTSVNRYKAGSKTVIEIGAELDVATVMEGSVRRSNDRIRIVSQLLDARTGALLWSDSFDREVKDIFQIQAEVSRKIAIALKGELTVVEAERLRPAGARDFEAFNLYLKGRYHWSLRSEDGFRRSLQYYQEAIGRDPRYALAHAGMADTYSLMGAYGMMLNSDAAARAMEAALKAVDLDPSLAEAHASLGYAQKNRFEWAAAETNLKRAIALKPGYAPAHHWYSIYLTQQGDFTGATSEIKTAISLDPFSISANTHLGTVLLLGRRYDDAIAQYQKTLAMDASFSTAHQSIGEAYAYKKDHDRAIASYQMAAKVGTVGREDHEQQADLGYALAMAGRRLEATKVLSVLLQRERQNPLGIAANIATVHAALGHRDLAFTWLAKAFERGDLEIGYLKVDPRWDSLRADSRFDKLLARIGFRRESGRTRSDPNRE